jgi:hypothetical protein
MKAVLWTPGQPLGNLTAKRVKEIQGTHNGPLVAVIDDNDGVMIIQPMDPNTGQDWESEEDALAFAERYMAPAPEIDEEDQATPEEI